jgi:hypothetical protein
LKHRNRSTMEFQIPEYIMIPCSSSSGSSTCSENGDDSSDSGGCFERNLDDIVLPPNIMALMSLSQDEKRRSIQSRWEEGESSSGDRHKHSPNLPRRSWMVTATASATTVTLTCHHHRGVCATTSSAVVNAVTSSPPQKPQRRPPLIRAYSCPSLLHGESSALLRNDKMQASRPDQLRRGCCPRRSSSSSSVQIIKSNHTWLSHHHLAAPAAVGA